MIGLIGYGRFGKLIVQYISSDFDVVVYTRNTEKKLDIQKTGGRLVSLDEACARKIVILCVPISVMPSTLKQIAPLLKPGTIVMDVCSVKVLPVQWMHRELPEHVEILATHPMFGPDSARQSLAGHKLVLCPERIRLKHLNGIKTWMESKDLKIVETTPDEHDRQIAISLALTHFIGRSLSAFGAKHIDIDTEGYKRLLHILNVVENDTWQLFEDMHHFNPYAGETRQSFIQAMMNIHHNLGD